MIQFNLLPDIKIEYLKANRQKHYVVLISVLATIAALAVLAVLLALVFVVQRKSISDLSADIKVSSNKLQSTKDLTKILTVQNQLRALTGLHDGKPVVSRLFTYLDQSIPEKAVNSRILSDFSLNTLLLSGSADSLATINTYIDTLKNAKFITKSDSKTEKNAFTEVVLATFGRDTQSATYTISLKFDPLIFSGIDEATFVTDVVVDSGAEQ